MLRPEPSSSSYSIQYAPAGLTIDTQGFTQVRPSLRTRNASAATGNFGLQPLKVLDPSGK